MNKLYVKDLKIASAAGLGTHQWKKGEGECDHVGVKVKELEPVVA
jgi:hypothetical protein